MHQGSGMDISMNSTLYINAIREHGLSAVRAWVSACVCVSICVWLALSVFVHLRLFIFQLFIAHYFLRFCRSGIQNINCFSFRFLFFRFLFIFFLHFGLDKIAACNIYTCQKYCMKSKLFVLKSFDVTVSISHIDRHI